MQKLNLTDDQKKQVADLEAEVKVKMEKILTPEQLQQLAQMRPPRPPGGPGGPGGGPDGDGNTPPPSSNN
jgi:Spy/CpxP family protein refolding chaperone